MVERPRTDDLVRALRRLPLWSAVARTARLLGVPELKPAPLRPRPDPAPLDSFVQSAPNELVAGAARIDITPPDPAGVYLGGFGPDRRSIGVRDPILARALVVSDGRTPIVIVALDLIGLSLVRTERIRSLLTRRHSDSVLIHCTHNHQSPDTLGLWGKSLAGLLPCRSGIEPAYMEWLERRVLASVQEAIADARPVRLGFAQGEFDRGGRWVHNERSPLVDRTMRVLALTTDDGEPVASLVQHACHPETLWKQSRLISADFCGVCCHAVEERIGGVALYINGALGAMVSAALPRDASTQQRDGFLTGLGNAMGKRAVNLLKRAREQPIADPRIRSVCRTVLLPAEGNPFFALLHAMGVVEHRDLDGGWPTEVGFHRLGPASFTALPGEAAPALAFEIQKRLPGTPRFLIGLANDELGYLLPPEFFHDRAYTYECTMSPGPQVAARLTLAVEEAARACEIDRSTHG